MKTDKCFAIEAFKPCPHCGSPRVGKDYDDDYYVVPGLIREVADCDSEDVELKVDREVGRKNRDVLRATLAKARELADAAPCKCGAPRTVVESLDWHFFYFRVACRKRQHIRRVFEPLEGCPRCYESHGFSWLAD